MYTSFLLKHRFPMNCKKNNEIQNVLCKNYDSLLFIPLNLKLDRIEGLSRMIKSSKEEGTFQGINISRSLAITHLLFVDDIVIFGSSSYNDWHKIISIFATFSQATGMVINFQKTVIIPIGMSQDLLEPILTLFPARVDSLEHGLKYLGYYIKANNYHTRDWQWLLGKLEHKINHWCNRYLSLGGRLTLLSYVLSAIPVYWFSLAQVPVAVTEALRKKMINFLWGQTKQVHKYHLVSWRKIFPPKSLGGWGIRQPYWFNIALCVKVAWRALSGKGLWHDIIREKYMKGLSTEIWIIYRLFHHRGGSLFWRSVCKNFHRIHNGLTWQIGNGKLVRIGLDPFTGITDNSYMLPEHMVISLQLRGFGRLDKIHCSTVGSPHYWYTSQELGFVGTDMAHWNRYIGML